MKPSQAPDRSLSGMGDVWLICSPTSCSSSPAQRLDSERLDYSYLPGLRRLHLVELTFGGTKHISPWNHLLETCPY
jgi:hypothetical protein